MARSYSVRDGLRNHPSLRVICRIVGRSILVPSGNMQTGRCVPSSFTSTQRKGTSLRWRKSRIAYACADPRRPTTVTNGSAPCGGAVLEPASLACIALRPRTQAESAGSRPDVLVEDSREVCLGLVADARRDLHQCDVRVGQQGLLG